VKPSVLRGKTNTLTWELKPHYNESKMIKEKLYGKTLNELIAVTKRIGLPGFAAKQISDWLYKKEIQSIEEMTNLSKKTRELLVTDYEIGLSAPVNEA
jgi:23S rRNA (adenine2503-C2)-methyltransferase